MVQSSNYILVRYGDLTDPSCEMFVNYKIPQDHSIISSIRDRCDEVTCIQHCGGSVGFFGFVSDSIDDELEEFFISDNGGARAYKTTMDLLAACRDPEIKEVLELNYYC